MCQARVLEKRATECIVLLLAHRLVSKHIVDALSAGFIVRLFGKHSDAFAVECAFCVLFFGWQFLFGSR